MNLKEIIKEEIKILTEMVSNGEIYHYTNTNSIEKILKTNTFMLSSGLGTSTDNIGNKLFFLSLSRTKSVKVGYLGNKSERMIRLVLDGNKLNHNFKSISTDYWGDNSKIKDKFEYEDRILTDKSTIPNANRYILRIEAIYPLNLYDNKTSSEIIRFQNIIQLADNLNIPVFIYDNESDLNKRINPINDQILNINNAKEPYVGSDRSVDASTYAKIIALLLYDEKYLVDKGREILYPDIDKFITLNNIQLDKDIKDQVYDYIYKLYYGDSHAVDFWNSLSADLHNYFKNGGEGNFRKDILLLVKEMRKYQVNNIPDLIKIKTKGIKPKQNFVDYSKTYYIYKIDYNYENNKYEWYKLDNDKPISDAITYLLYKSRNNFNYLTNEDTDFIYDLKYKNKITGDAINYLLNKYTVERIQNIIKLSSYDKNNDITEFKLDK